MRGRSTVMEEPRKEIVCHWKVLSAGSVSAPYRDLKYRCESPYDHTQTVPSISRNRIFAMDVWRAEARPRRTTRCARGSPICLERGRVPSMTRVNRVEMRDVYTRCSLRLVDREERTCLSLRTRSCALRVSNENK